MPTLHGHPLSPFVRKVKLALLEKKIEHEHQPVMPTEPFNSTPEFRAMSPLGKIPAYEDSGFSIADSSVIVQYLERTTPEPSLLPNDARQLAKALFIEELADTKMAEVVGPVFQQRIVMTRFLGQEANQTIIDEALASVPAVFDIVETRLAGEPGPWAVGDSLSIADLAIASMARQFELSGEAVDPARWPKLARVNEAVKSRPSYVAIMASEDASLGG